MSFLKSARVHPQDLLYFAYLSNTRHLGKHHLSHTNSYHYYVKKEKRSRGSRGTFNVGIEVIMLVLFSLDSSCDNFLSSLTTLDPN